MRVSIANRLAAVAVAFALGCSDVTDPGLADCTAGKCDSSESAPVALRYAKPYNDNSHWVAVVRVDNHYFMQKLFVRYQLDAGPWDEVEGKFLRAIGPQGQNRQLWYVDRLPAVVNQQVKPLRFAVRYQVTYSGGTGRELWDNNHGDDYWATSASSPLGPGVNVAVRSVSVDKASATSNDYVLTTALLVRNLAFDKHVRVIYTTDGWVTSHIAPAHFEQGDGSGGETWASSATIDPNVTSIELAVVATQHGVDAWDNNFDDNFTCTRDPNATAWTCAGAALVHCQADGCMP